MSTHVDSEPVRAMLALVASLPDQLEASAKIAQDYAAGSKVRRVVLCGMGGSSIAGALLGGAFAAELELHVRRAYRLPPWLDAESLLIFSSYSGNTEETLAAYDESRALPRTRRLAIGAGGELASRARRDGVPHLRLPDGLPPRAALGYGVGVLRHVLGREGLLPPADEDLSAAVAQLRRGNESLAPTAAADGNRARQLARQLRDRWPVLYASSPLTAAVATRWGNQFNENAKVLAHVAELPELDHNEIVGWGRQSAARDAAFVLALREAGEDPRVARRIAATRSVLANSVPTWQEIDAQGERPFVRALDLVQLGDFVSVYLAAETGVDPIEIEAIDRLKRSLRPED